MQSQEGMAHVPIKASMERISLTRIIVHPLPIYKMQNIFSLVTMVLLMTIGSHFRGFSNI